MRKNILKKVILAGIWTYMTLSISGCSADIDDALTDYQSTIQNRVSLNVNELGRLKDVGLVTVPMYDALVAELNSNVKKLSEIDETNIDKKSKILKPSVTYVCGTGFLAYDTVIANANDEQSKYPSMTNWCNAMRANLLKDYIGVSGKIDPPTRAFELFSLKNENSSGELDISNGAFTINTIVNSEIYVLKSDTLIGQDLSNISSSCNIIKKYQGQDSSKLTEEERKELEIARANVKSSFTDSGISLMSGEESLTVETTFNDDAYEAVATDVKSVTEDGINKLGKDLVIFSDSFPVFSVRLRELNKKTVDSLVNKAKNSTNAYLIDFIDGDATKGVRIYSMVYPASYIDSIKWDDTNKKANITTKTSDLISVNIMSGEVVNQTESSLLTDEQQKELEKIYNVLGNSDNNSSFEIWSLGKGMHEVVSNSVSAQKDYEYNTILLKDYMEYTYLPEFMPNEGFVALGRRVRFNEFEYDKTNNIGYIKDHTNIAKFIDKTGRPIDGAVSLGVDDLLDRKSGNEDNDKKALRLSNAGSTTSGTNNTTVPEGEWKNGESPNDSKWWYEKSDGTYFTDEWVWIDGNDDGTAECYHFNADGWLDVSTNINSDTVNSDGAWILDGTVQTKKVQTDTISNAGDNGSTGFASDKTELQFTSVEYKDEIFPVTTFPVNDTTDKFAIASEDAQFNGGVDSRTILYGICTDVDLFKSQLYSGWINVKGDGGTVGSLVWWNAWLGKAKYIYTINTNALAEYLGLNFTANVVGKDSSLIILDKETISKIQLDIKQDERVDKVTWIRTMFVALGYVAIVYAFLLMAAWVIDTGTIMETKIMGYLTRGKCIAIRDQIEIPSMNIEGKSYVTFSSVIIRAIVIIVIAIVLTQTDFIAILATIYNAVVGLAELIYQRVFNI